MSPLSLLRRAFRLGDGTIRFLGLGDADADADDRGDEKGELRMNVGRLALRRRLGAGERDEAFANGEAVGALFISTGSDDQTIRYDESLP